MSSHDVDPSFAFRRAGDPIGPYRLVRQLAEGGMGSVWLAERADGLLGRPVALKLPRALARPGLAERMGREREILASLNHAHIARLYDAGFGSDGQPYLALEYVEGRPLDEYARAERLDLRSRLRLFGQVADAVAHAHGRLVVHRDLKPGNILVTSEGQVRLLDFGIAKLLDEGRADETELTRISGRMLTLRYASPEQIEGLPLGVASDVYSLGVVLYELLTGTGPYELERDTPAAVEDAVLHADPRRPSDAASDRRIARALRGDLDSILLQALRKSPEERYPTVDAFADDVERYLDGRPVQARPDRALYRMRRFVGRNKLGVGAAAVVTLAVLAGAGVAVWQARVAQAEKRRAEEVKEFIASIFREASPYSAAGQVPTPADLLQQARERIDRNLAAGPALRVELFNIVASSLLALQETASAEPVVAQALAEARALGPGDPQALRAAVLSTQVHRFRGRTKEMRAELDRLLPILRNDPRALPDDLVYVLKQRAHLAIDEGRYDEAVASAREALAVAEARLGPQHTQTAATGIALANAYLYAKKPSLALQAAQDAYRRAQGAHPGQPKHPRIIEARQIYGRALAETGELEPAIEQLTQAVQDASDVFGDSAMMVGFFSQNLVPLLVEAGDNGRALETSEKALAILARHAERDSYTLAAATGSRGLARLAARQAEAALLDLTVARDGLAAKLGPEHARTSAFRVQRALALAYLGQVAEADEEIVRAMKSQREAADPSLSVSLHALGVSRRLAGDYAGALGVQREALAALAGPRAERERMAVLTEIGIDQIEMGSNADAESSLERAITLIGRQQRRPTPLRADALVGLGRVRLGLGRPSDALAPLREADAFWSGLGEGGGRWGGEAALWLGRCYAALGREAEGRAADSRARTSLSRSPLPADARLLRLVRPG